MILRSSVLEFVDEFGMFYVQVGRVWVYYIFEKWFLKNLLCEFIFDSIDFQEFQFSDAK